MYEAKLVRAVKELLRLLTKFFSINYWFIYAKIYTESVYDDIKIVKIKDKFGGKMLRSFHGCMVKHAFKMNITKKSGKKTKKPKRKKWKAFRKVKSMTTYRSNITKKR